MIRSPIKWAGGKSRFREQIVSLLPNHSCYIEPFSGAAWVLFAKPRSDVEVLNDIDGELVNFFRIVKHHPEEFIDTFKMELVSREEFNRLANLDTSKMTELDRAHRFYYIIMAGWGGELNYPRFQTSISDGGHGNRLIGALKFLEERIYPVHERLSKVIIENLDWRDCFKKYDSEKTVMYLDPPYPGNGVNYLFNMRDWEDHIELANALKKAKSKWILSSYDNADVKALFSGIENIKIIETSRYSGMKKKKNGTEMTKNQEVLILNFDPNKDKFLDSGQSELNL
jgi:DNA adenine methylase